jgi:predicted PurR-regulated permease PerM
MDSQSQKNSGSVEASPARKIPDLSARQVVYATLIIAFILVVFGLLYRFSNIIFIFLISIVLSTAIRPAVTKMSRHGIPKSGGVILIYLLGLSLVVLFVIFAFPLFVDQIAEISHDLPAYYGSFRSVLLHSPSHILVLLAAQLPAGIQLLTTNLTSGSGAPLTQVTRSFYYIGFFIRGAFTLTAILILAFYWTLESERSIRSLLLWVPMNNRDQFRDFLVDIEDKVGGFILGQSILCLSIGAMAFVAYQLIGLPYALVLAPIAAIMEAVPIVGPALGAVPALLVALSFAPDKTIWVVISTLVIQGLENYLLVPRVMKRSVGVNPLLVLLTIAAFTALFGLAGAVLSIPIAAVIQLSLDRFVVQPSAADSFTSDGRGRLSLLRYEAQTLGQDMRKQLRQNEHVEPSTDDAVDSLEAIARDLDQLLGETEQRMSEN